MKQNYAQLQREGGMRGLIGKFGLLVAALLPCVRAVSQTPVVVVTPPGACTTGNLTATSTIQPLSIAWTGPSSGTVNATWGASGTKIAGNSVGSGLNQLDNPNGLFLDGSGNLYVADFNNNRVIKFTPPFNSANNGTVVAGTGTAGSANTQLNGPTAVYVDGSGDVFVCDQGNNRIMEWSSPYTSGTCVAGGNGFASGNTALAAPFGLYLDASGNLFVGDKSNNRIQRFTASQIASATAGQTSASVAGTTVLGGNGTGSGNTQLNFPSGVFVDGSGNLYVADYNNNRIQKITAAQIAAATAGQTSSTAAATTPAGGNGAGTGANQLDQPNSVFLDCANNIYIADYSNNRVQQWLSGASSGTTIAGSSSGTAGSSATLLSLPSDAVLDASGNLYVTDYNNSRVQEYAPAIVNTFAYTLNGTYTATVTTFTCATGSGSATTTTNSAIITQPTSQTVCAGSSATFTVVASGTGITYQWFQNGVSLGAPAGAYSGTQSATLTINPTTSAMNGNTYSVQVYGTCNPLGVTSSTVSLTVNSAASIIASPPTSQTTCVGSNTAISVSASGTSLTYQWQVNPPSGFGNVPSTINYSGQTTTTLSILNTPAGFNGNQYRVIVTSSVCPGSVTSSATTLSVNALPVITQSPLPVTVCSGGNATFQVTATGSGLTYQWQDSVAGSGVWTNQTNITPFTGANTPTLNLTGVTTTMNGNGYRCVVTSGAGCIATSSTALLTVNPIPAITLGTISAICAGSTSASLPYSGLTGGTSFTYTINTWSGGTFANVTAATLPASPINIVVPGTTPANTYTANFFITNSTGCSSTTSTISLTVNPLPAISTGAVAAVCSGTTSSAVGYTVTSGTPTTYSITWSAAATTAGFVNTSGGLVASPIPFAVPAGAAPATYTANLSVTDGNGCTSTNAPFSITINPNPTITLGIVTPVCAGSVSTSVTYTSTGSPNTYGIVWSPAATTAGFTNIPLGTTLPSSPLGITVPGLAAPGTYTGTLTVSNSATGCSSGSNTISVTINPNPTITLGANPAVCYGTTSANLPYTSTTNSPSNYSITWSGAALSAGFTNVTTTSLSSSPIVLTVPAIANPATYSGTLFVYTASGCQNGAGTPFTITINPIPSISPTTIAPGVNASICKGSSPALLNYSGTTGSPDQYSITAWGTSTSASFATSANQAFTSPNPISIAIPLTATAGLDTAYLTVTNSATGCTSAAPGVPVVVQINGLPFISLGVNPTVCQGVTSDTLGYTITNVNPIHNPVSYSILWSPAATAAGFLTVNTTPLPASPITIAIPAGAAANTYSGTITVTNSFGCSSNYTFSVIVNPTPTITMNAAPFVCSLQTNVNYGYLATSGGPISTYSIAWSALALGQLFVPVNNNSFPASPISVTVPANAVPSTYTGTITVTSTAGCTSTGTTINIAILPLPSVTLGASPAVCSGVTSTSITYSGATGSPNQYYITWAPASLGQGFNNTATLTLPASPIPITVPAAATPGTYFDTIYVKNTTCTSLPNPSQVTINPLPTITLTSNSQSVCLGAASVNFPYTGTTNSPTNYSITNWSGGGFANVIGALLPPSPINIPIPGTTVAGTYTATLTVFNGCTSLNQTITVVINPLPTITLGANPAICSGSTTANLTYSAVGNGANQYSITWSSTLAPVGPPAVTLPSSPIPITVPGTATAGVYNGTLTVTNSTTGCVSNNYLISVTLDQTPAAPVVSPSPDTICAGNPLVITGITSTSGTPNITYAWTGPSSTYFTGTQSSVKSTGINDTLQLTNPLAITGETGTYTLQDTITYGGTLKCWSSITTEQVYVIPAPPNPNPSSNSPLCVGATLQLHAGVSFVPGYTYYWNGPSCGLGFSTVQTTSTDTFKINVNTCDSGDYIIYTSGTTGSYTCFSNAVSTHVSVNPLPNNPTTNVDVPSHSITVCQNTSVNVNGFYTPPAPSFLWTPVSPTTNCLYGDSSSGQNLSIPSAQLCDSGLYLFTEYLVYQRQGVTLTCYSAVPDLIHVYVNALPPTPLVVSVNSPVCLGDSLHFMGQFNANYTYQWSDSSSGTVGSHAFATGADTGDVVSIANVIYPDSGWVVVNTANYIRGYQCLSASDVPLHIAIKPLPQTPSILNVPALCVGDTLRVVAVDTQHNITYIWRPNNPDSCYQCDGPLPPNFGNHTLGINDLDSVTTATLRVNSALAIDSGLYRVYSVLNGCRSGLPASVQVTVRPLPNIPGDSSNSPICQFTTLHLVSYDTVSNPTGPPSLAGGLNYTWTGPNGFSSTTQNPNLDTVGLLDAGTYCVTASLNGCPSSVPACINVVIEPIPANPLASSNAPVCSGAPNVLSLCADSTTPGITYLWSGPIPLVAYNPTTRCVNIPAPTAAMSGQYSVFAVLTYNYIKNGTPQTLACPSAVPGITNVIVNATPAPPTVSNITYCQNAPVSPLVAGGANLLWYTTAVGGIGTTVNPTPYDSLPGITNWYVSQSGADGCASTRSALAVTVLQQSLPPYVPNPTVTYCQDDVPVMLNAVGVALQWYTTPTGGVGSYITPTPSTATAGTTVWYVTQTTNGCESQRVPITVIVNQKPQPPIVENVTYCQNDPAVPLTAIGQNLLWYTTLTGGFGASAGPTPNTSVPDTIIYYVTESFNGCTSIRVPQYVYVLAAPNAVIVPSKPYVCEDSTISFQYFGSALPDASFDWGLPQGAMWDSGRGPGPIWVTFDSPGTQSITLIVSNGQCKSASAVYNVTVRPMPTQTIGSVSQICQGTQMIVGLGTTTLGVTGYTWNFDSTGAYLGNGLYDTGAQIISSAGPEGPFTIIWNVPGLQVIKVMSVLDDCPSGWTVDTINVHPLPDARISNANIGIPCTNDSVQFSALIPTEEDLYFWSPTIFFVNGNSSPVVNGNVHYSSNVYLTVTTPYGCTAEDSLYVQTDSCCAVNLPNAFTPNGDGLNDVFRPYLKEKGNHVLKVFRISNRWGQTVFETTNEKQGWDGKFNGVDQDMDVYFWFIDYICSYNNVRYQERGDCTLIR